MDFKKLANQYKDELLDNVLPFWLENSQDHGICGSHLYSLGRDLYHDGYSLLVHDTGIYSQWKRA